MNIEKIIEQTELYIAGEISEQNRSLATMMLNELKKIKNDESYIVPANVMRSIMDSFDMSSDYWKKGLSVFWNENLSKFKNPYE